MKKIFLGAIVMSSIMLSPIYGDGETSRVRRWGVDPFHPNQNTGTLSETSFNGIPIETSLFLQGISRVDNVYKAMISGVIVQDGDFVEDFQVQKIFESTVLITSSTGETFRLRFKD